MDVAYIAIGVIIVIGIGISFLVRKAIVANVRLFDGEEILFERDGVRVQVQTVRRLNELRGAFVRVTNRRVFVGTGKLSSPKRAVISYAMSLDSDDFGGGAMSDGFITFPARRDEVTIVEGRVRIPSREGEASLEVPKSVAVELDPPEVLRAAIVEQQKPPNEAGRYRA